MKKLFVILSLSVLLSSCKVVYVWTLSDLIGLILGGIGVLIILVYFGYLWIASKIRSRRIKRKLNREQIDKMDLFIK